MLSFFRRSALMVKILFLSLAGLVALSMVVTLIPGMIGFSADPAAIQVVAEVGNEEITTFDVQQQVMQMGRTNQVPAEMLWLYTAQVLDQMVLEKASVLAAERMGLRVTEADLRMRLRLIPELFPQGQFVGPEEYEMMVQNRFGTSVGAFETRFRNSLLMEKLRQVVTDSIGVSQREVHEAFVKANEKFVIDYVLFNPLDYESAVTVTDAALQEYFEKNTARYQLPERRRAKILLLDKQKVRESVSVTDVEKQKYYQDNLDNYRQQERVSVSHILFRATEQEPEKMEAARKKAADLLEQLKGGANFEALAKANSEDTGSAASGGDLGWIVRGQTVANFERAAFSLEPGTLSDPIQTEYGIHLLRVTAHEQARVRPLEEVASEIQNLLLDEKVQSSLSSSAEQAAADWRREPEQLNEIAERYHGSVLTPPPFGRGEMMEGITGSQAASEDVFILAAGEIGRPVEVPAGFAIPLLEEITPSRTPEFAEVKERVRTFFVEEKSREQAHAKAMELVQTLEQQQDRDLPRQARAMRLTPATTESLTRAGSIPSVGTVMDLGPRLETIQPGEIAGPVPVSGNHVVYQLESREAPDEQLFEIQRDPLRQQLQTQKQNMAFASFQNSLKTRMMESGDVRVDAAVLERLNSQAVQ